MPRSIASPMVVVSSGGAGRNVPRPCSASLFPDSFDHIIETATQMRDKITGIEACRERTGGIDQVSQSIARIDDVSQGLAASARFH